MKRMFCVVTMLCVLASCVTVHAEENAATLDGTNGDVLYQVALIQSLVQGYYDGIITVGELKQHGDTGIGTFEGLNGEMIVLDGTVYQAVADGSALVEAAKEDGTPWHVGVLQCKDSFYGQHNPDSMPVGYELKAKWDAFIACGALASEMESAALFTVGSVRGVRVGSIVQVLANQTRRAKGLEDNVTLDTEAAIRIGVEAMRKLIEADARE